MEKSLAVAHAEDLPIEPNEKLAINEVTVQAKQGAEAEHNLHPLKALRLYPKAIFWSVLISSTIIMVRANAPAAHHALVADHPDRRATTCV